MLIYKQFNEIKAVSDRKIEGRGIRFGSPQTADNYKEWFPDSVVTGVKNGDTRPFLIEHGKSKKFGLVILGDAVYEKSGEGWDYQVQLPHSEVGDLAFGELTSKRYKSSTGSAWHTTKFSLIENTYRLDSWFIVEQSATQTPADFYNPPIAIKSLLNGDSTDVDEIVKTLYDSVVQLQKDVIDIKNKEIEFFKQLVDKMSTDEIKKGVKLPEALLQEIEELTQTIELI